MFHSSITQTGLVSRKQLHTNDEGALCAKRGQKFIGIAYLMSAVATTAALRAILKQRVKSDLVFS